MKTSTPVCKTYGTHLFGYVVDFSSVTYGKYAPSSNNPVAENLRTVRLTMSHLLIDIRRKTEYVTLFLSSLCLV